MKRLTSEEVLRYAGTGGVSGPVVTDWLQAREDVKRLGEMLRRALAYAQGTQFALEAVALLSEVGQ
jgi:hypothetical protein